MAITTIEVDAAVRDRLERLAAAEGTSVAEYLAHMVRESTVPEDARGMTERNAAYVRKHLCTDLSEEDIARAEAFAEAVAAGSVGTVM